MSARSTATANMQAALKLREQENGSDVLARGGQDNSYICRTCMERRAGRARKPCAECQERCGGIMAAQALNMFVAALEQLDEPGAYNFGAQFPSKSLQGFTDAAVRQVFSRAYTHTRNLQRITDALALEMDRRDLTA